LTARPLALELESSQLAVVLLKNSEELSRLMAGCLDRAIAAVLALVTAKVVRVDLLSEADVAR
jgi:hypothetical protein